MDFNEIRRKYNLDFSGLAEILKKHQIVLNLEHLNAIPNAWIPIIEDSLGFKSSDREVKGLVSKEEEVLRGKKRQALEARKKEFARQSEVLREYKRSAKTKNTVINDNDETSENKSIVIEDDLGSTEKIDSVDRKLSGPNFTGQKIDLSQFKNPKRTKNNKINKRISLKETGEVFYAFVKFVGSESDHAFIKPISDLNFIDSLDVWAKDDSDFLLKEDCSYIKQGQIVLCESKSEKYHTAKIKSEIFEGTISNLSRSAIFVDWLSFNSPIVISEVKTFGFENNDALVGASLFYSNNRIHCKKLDADIKAPEIISKMEGTIVAMTSKVVLPEITPKLIESYKSSVEVIAYDNFMINLFEEDFRKYGDFLEKEKVLTFINKWQLIDPSFITIDNLKGDKHFSLYFEMWLNEKLPLSFWEKDLIEMCIKYDSLIYESDLDIFQSKLQKSHLEVISNALDLFLKNDFEITNLNQLKVLNTLLSFSILPDKEKLFNKIQTALSKELSFENWVKDGGGSFDTELAVGRFSHSDVELQGRILSELSINDIVPLLLSINEVTNIEVEKKVNAALLNSVSRKLSFISFDLESNGKEIFELGWVNDEDSEYHFSATNKLDDGIELFRELTQPSNIIFIGHNIVEWDVPILSDRGISINPDQIWDTLQMEAFLSPEFKKYALITPHNAIDDAKLTRDLFLNQLLRILYMEEDKLVHLFSYLPAKTIEIIGKLKKEQSINWNPLEALKKEKIGFYRPQPLPNTIVEQVKEFIAISEAENVLIVGPEYFKSEILEIENIKFHVDNSTHKNYYKLNRDRIEAIDESHVWLKQVLLNFVDYNSSLNNPSFFGKLPTSIRIQADNKIENILELFYPVEEIGWDLKNVLFFTIPELIFYYNDLLRLPGIDLITIQNDLISVENKKLLKEISLDFLMNETKNEDHIWLKFSGGQSFVELSNKQCEDLQVDIPNLYDNIWIEKYTYNKFRIWGNYNWEQLIDEFKVISKIDIQPEINQFDSAQAIVVQISETEALKSKVIRFNPEVLFRSRYWVFQKQLINQIVTQGVPSILCIQRFDEIEVLRNYFTHLGYYIPNNSISVGRRLELLHQNKSEYKLIIEHIDKLESVIEANHLGGLNIIYDSFKLYENYYSAHNSNYFRDLNSKRLRRLGELQSNEKEEVINETEMLSDSKKPVISDTFFLIELLKPKVAHIRSLLQIANAEHKLWILDPRLNDFQDLYKSWNMSQKKLNVWNDFDAYESDVKEADVHIDSVKPIRDLPYDKERMKEILRQVFLKDFNWRPSQIPYLDLILDGKEDQLITLPTGEGKSVLFQGPALFKGAFSNRLTIVVTPLKALMEDQVDSLWEKGFFGSVDYINSDRSSDLNSIYRAIAGGELSLLFVTPERFRSRSFNNALQMRIQSDGGLEYGVFDEAHCVSQWGHEFRPDYFNCAKRLVRLKSFSSNKFPLLLFSATVSEKIYTDFKTIFS